jgi:hypothetical protein
MYQENRKFGDLDVRRNLARPGKPDHFQGVISPAKLDGRRPEKQSTVQNIR